MTPLKKFLIWFLLQSCGICYGQNLVPNGDFEQYWGCPYWVSEIDSTKFWFSPTQGTPDYFNQCSSFTANVPDTWNGYQPAHSGGAFTGLHRMHWSQTDFREYIEIALNVPHTQTLIPNACYRFEMYVNLGNICKYTCPNIGVYFSDTAVTGITNMQPLPFTPQITNATGNSPDTLNWLMVSGDYTAHGGERYLIIGNFDNDSLTTLSIVNATSNYPASYVFIDDVSLTFCSPAGTDDPTTSHISVFPNPVTSYLTITCDSDYESEVILYDITSRVLFKQFFTSSTTINTSQFTAGLYFYEVRNKNGSVSCGRVIKH